MNPENKPAGPVTKSEGQEMVFDKYVAIALVVGIIAGFIIGHSVGASKSKVENASSTAETMIVGDDASSSDTGTSMTSMSTSPLQAGDMVTVNDQKAGSNVIVSKLTLDKSYWVAVQDGRSTNAHSYILGAKKLMAGTYTDESIYVSRATEAGKSYDIVFYQDKGDFNYDPSLLIMNGADPVGATFKAN